MCVSVAIVIINLSVTLLLNTLHNNSRDLWHGMAQVHRIVIIGWRLFHEILPEIPCPTLSPNTMSCIHTFAHTCVDKRHMLRSHYNTKTYSSSVVLTVSVSPSSMEDSKESCELSCFLGEPVFRQDIDGHISSHFPFQVVRHLLIALGCTHVKWLLACCWRYICRCRHHCQ